METSKPADFILSVLSNQPFPIDYKSKPTDYLSYIIKVQHEYMYTCIPHTRTKIQNKGEKQNNARQTDMDLVEETVQQEIKGVEMSQKSIVLFFRDDLAESEH